MLTGPGSPSSWRFLYSSRRVRVQSGEASERRGRGDGRSEGALARRGRTLLARQIINNQAGVCAVLARFANEPAFSRCRLEAYNYMLASLLVCTPRDTAGYLQGVPITQIDRIWILQANHQLVRCNVHCRLQVCLNTNFTNEMREAYTLIFDVSLKQKRRYVNSNTSFIDPKR